MRFVVGQAITLTGIALDRKIPWSLSAIGWSVLLHHNTHTHPFLLPTSGNRIKIEAPAPENLEAALNSYLEVRLTATDSRGLSRTALRIVRPRVVGVTFATQPTRLPLQIEGLSVATPRTVFSWPGYKINVVAPVQTAPEGRLQLQRWNDGSVQPARTIVTPYIGVSYTAFYVLPPLPPRKTFLPLVRTSAEP